MNYLLIGILFIMAVLVASQFNYTIDNNIVIIVTAWLILLAALSKSKSYGTKYDEKQIYPNSLVLNNLQQDYIASGLKHDHDSSLYENPDSYEGKSNGVTQFEMISEMLDESRENKLFQQRNTVIPSSPHSGQNTLIGKDRSYLNWDKVTY